MQSPAAPQKQGPMAMLPVGVKQRGSGGCSEGCCFAPAAILLLEKVVFMVVISGRVGKG